MENQELKVVLHLKGNRALVGVQQPDSDPVLETLEAGTLAELLAAVPGIVARAREKWAASPKNPAYVGPPPPPAPTPRPVTPARAARPAEPQAGAMRPLF